MRIRWLNSAIRSLRSIHAPIALENPGDARRIFSELRDTTSRLRSFPACGREGKVPGTMERGIPNLPYIIVYRVTDDSVDILHIIRNETNSPVNP